MNAKAPPAPVIERVAALAMQLGSRHLAEYGATRSRHDFTQRQLMACLIVRAYTKTTYRGVIEFLSVSPSVRQALGLQDQWPHYTTLQKFSARSMVLEIADAMTSSGYPSTPRFRRHRREPLPLDSLQATSAAKLLANWPRRKNAAMPCRPRIGVPEVSRCSICKSPGIVGSVESGL